MTQARNLDLGAELRVRRGDFELALALEAGAGTTLALVGPNGAGKSTALAALAGLVPLCAGSIRVGARLLEDTLARTRLPPQDRDVGLCFQGQALFPHLSAVDNVAYGLRARGMARTQARALAHTWLERLDGGPSSEAGPSGAWRERRPAQLSGGQAQRVALARALATEPALLLLDEPLAGLDVQAQAQTRALLARTLASFEGVRVFTTHDFRDVLRLADRVLVLEAGAVVQSGCPQEIAAAPGSEHLRAMVAALDPERQQESSGARSGASST